MGGRVRSDLRRLALLPWASARSRELHRRRVRFHRGLIEAGDLVIDVGANVGERSAVFLELGARVVAVEPQAECAEQLRRRWGSEERFALFEGSCAERAGEAELFVADASTLSTMSPGWIERVSESGRFAGHRWNERRVVTTTTLDALIAEHGDPAFVKIDVEGFEEQVLAGLTRPVKSLSVEWAQESLPTTHGCVETLDALGMSEFNLSRGESMSFALPRWVSAEEIAEALSGSAGELAWGDLYARMPPDSISR